MGGRGDESGVGGWLDGWVDGRMDGWMGRWVGVDGWLGKEERVASEA